MPTRSIPWPRILAEGAAIVVSILLAFGIQAWWEGQRERRQEIEYLMALRSELTGALLNHQEVSEALARNHHGHEALIRQFREDSLAPEDSLIFWLSNLSWPGQFTPPTAVLSDLVSSGGVQLIEDDSLRLMVAEYSRLLDAHSASRNQAWATWAERIQPYLEGRVSRVERLRRGSYQRRVPFDGSPFVPAYQELFLDPVFESMVAERWIRLDSMTNLLEEIGLLIDSIISRINRELA